MKAERRHELRKNSLVRSLEHLPSAGKQYATRLGLGLTLVILVVVLIRYRMNTNAARLSTATISLNEARDSLRRLSSSDLLIPQSGAEAVVVQARNSIFASGLKAADDALAAVSDAHSPIRSQALLCKGDLNFTMANYPEIPGASTRPSLQGEPADQLLSDAAAAYNQLLQDFPDDISVVTAARFGIAAVAENRAVLTPPDATQWDKAGQQYQLIIAGTAPQGFRQIAEQRLALLAQLRSPMFVSVKPEVATRPSTEPDAIVGPPGPSISPPPATNPSLDGTTLPPTR